MDSGYLLGKDVLARLYLASDSGSSGFGGFFLPAVAGEVLARLRIDDPAGAMAHQTSLQYGLEACGRYMLFQYREIIEEALKVETGPEGACRERACWEEAEKGYRRRFRQMDIGNLQRDTVTIGCLLQEFNTHPEWYCAVGDNELYEYIRSDIIYATTLPDSLPFGRVVFMLSCTGGVGAYLDMMLAGDIKNQWQVFEREFGRAAGYATSLLQGGGRMNRWS